MWYAWLARYYEMGALAAVSTLHQNPLLDHEPCDSSAPTLDTLPLCGRKAARREASDHLFPPPPLSFPGSSNLPEHEEISPSSCTVWSPLFENSPCKDLSYQNPGISLKVLSSSLPAEADSQNGTGAYPEQQQQQAAQVLTHIARIFNMQNSGSGTSNGALHKPYHDQSPAPSSPREDQGTGAHGWGNPSSSYAELKAGFWKRLAEQRCSTSKDDDDDDHLVCNTTGGIENIEDSEASSLQRSAVEEGRKEEHTEMQKPGIGRGRVVERLSKPAAKIAEVLESAQCNSDVHESTDHEGMISSEPLLWSGNGGFSLVTKDDPKQNGAVEINFIDLHYQRPDLSVDYNVEQIETNSIAQGADRACRESANQECTTSSIAINMTSGAIGCGRVAKLGVRSQPWVSSRPLITQQGPDCKLGKDSDTGEFINQNMCPNWCVMDSYVTTYSDGKETVWTVRGFEEDDGVFDETGSADCLREGGTLVRLISDKMPGVGGVSIAGIPLEGPQLGQTGDRADPSPKWTQQVSEEEAVLAKSVKTKKVSSPKWSLHNKIAVKNMRRKNGSCPNWSEHGSESLIVGNSMRIRPSAACFPKKSEQCVQDTASARTMKKNNAGVRPLRSTTVLAVQQNQTQFQALQDDGNCAVKNLRIKTGPSSNGRTQPAGSLLDHVEAVKKLRTTNGSFSNCKQLGTTSMQGPMLKNSTTKSPVPSPQWTQHFGTKERVQAKNLRKKIVPDLKEKVTKNLGTKTRFFHKPSEQSTDEDTTVKIRSKVVSTLKRTQQPTSSENASTLPRNVRPKNKSPEQSHQVLQEPEAVIKTLRTKHHHHEPSSLTTWPQQTLQVTVARNLKTSDGSSSSPWTQPVARNVRMKSAVSVPTWTQQALQQTTVVKRMRKRNGFPPKWTEEASQQIVVFRNLGIRNGTWAQALQGRVSANAVPDDTSHRYKNGKIGVQLMQKAQAHYSLEKSGHVRGPGLLLNGLISMGKILNCRMSIYSRLQGCSLKDNSISQTFLGSMGPRIGGPASTMLTEDTLIMETHTNMQGVETDPLTSMNESEKMHRHSDASIASLVSSTSTSDSQTDQPRGSLICKTWKRKKSWIKKRQSNAAMAMACCASTVDETSEIVHCMWEDMLALALNLSDMHEHDAEALQSSASIMRAHVNYLCSDLQGFQLAWEERKTRYPWQHLFKHVVVSVSLMWGALSVPHIIKLLTHLLGLPPRPATRKEKALVAAMFLCSGACFGKGVRQSLEHVQAIKKAQEAQLRKQLKLILQRVSQIAALTQINHHSLQAVQDKPTSVA